MYYAAWALDASAEDADLAASVAKAYVGDASRKVCGEAIQVHGGIGFTWEYDLHLYFKRAKALEVQYGDADYHRELIVGRVGGPERAGEARVPATHGTPLDGIRVVDCTSYIAGSYAAMMLADLGASVVKVESLEGDSFRELPGFYAWNRGKRSIALNLKSPEGVAVVERLAREGDVVMENMRPGVADRLGVGYEALARSIRGSSTAR